MALFNRTPAKPHDHHLADKHSADDDPQLRALRQQFPRVNPENLCLPGVMTRDEFIKFLTTLSEAISRDLAPKQSH